MEVQVIEKIQGRIDRATGLKINERLKVAAYARVSTDSEDQLNSFESQVKYYNEKISQKQLFIILTKLIFTNFNFLYKESLVYV